MYSVTDLFIYSYKKKEKEKEENIVEKKNCCGRTDGHQSTPSLNDKIDSGKSHLQVVEDIKRSGYTKNQPILLVGF